MRRQTAQICRNTVGSGTVLFLLSLLLTGCEKKSATVSGKVLFDGKPLSQGHVSFRIDNTHESSSIIDQDGSYQVKCEPGNAKITVRVSEFRPLAAGAKGKMDPAKFGAKGTVVNEKTRDKDLIKIPPKYSDPEQTPLTLPVKPGSQQHDIEIKQA